MDTPLAELLPLAHLDHRIDELTEGLRVRERKLRDLAAAVEAAETQLSELGQEAEALTQHERELATKVRKLEAARESAQRAWDQAIGDPAAAEHQLATAREHLDAVETEQLELMEGRDALETATAEAQTQREAALEALEGPKGEALRVERERLRTKLADAREARSEALGGLSRELRGRYEPLHDHCGGLALSPVGEDRTCGLCHRVVPLQKVTDAKDLRLVTCDGCGRLLYLPTT